MQKLKTSSVEVSKEFNFIYLHLKSHVHFDHISLIPGVQWSTNPKMRGAIITFWPAKQCTPKAKEFFIPMDIGADGIDYYGK